MKLFTNQEIRAIDRYTIESEGVTAMELIDRVGDAVTCEITARWRPTKPVMVMAGPGNNGADALTVARMLGEQGYRVEVFLFNIGGDKLSKECAACRDLLLSAAPQVTLHEVVTRFMPPEITSNHLIIDGLFGSGLRDELQGGFKSLVQLINEKNATVVSIDVPSGMFGDWNPQSINRNIIHATLTLAIQFPRLGFFMADNAELVGEWKVLDIGLSENAIAARTSSFYLIEKADAHRRLRHRKDFASKRDFGTAVIYAGSYGMMGAACLAARGALRSGVGKVALNSPKCGFNIIQTAVPEAIYQHNPGDYYITEIHPAPEVKSVAIGPGIGTNEKTLKALEDFLAGTNTPVVLDADALNCIASRPSILNSVPVLSIITPHPGEFDRLFGPQPSAEARLHKAIEMAKYYNILIILKGHYTAIVRPDGKIYFNSSGTPAMATAGSGDVLTGILASMLAQGYPPEIASIVAVYVHGVAGELAAEEHGEYGVTAGDIADNVGKAIKNIMAYKPRK